ncbi:YdcF family protein [Cesiribacter andamanensis]|uniref:DUF218 domain-containing protein n=1 Tax=Cesiribacter andamanensis AMV16 TaxID=1279009 RepID=M7N8U7_9BACT|nr:YdcF family protein [Cesiribacter andamanensis]EMR03682.1 hypothetical protein ADICEAN_01203 [Cesiribacter andamanensis AMV16]
MYFVLSKTVGLLVNPLVLLFALLIAGLLVKRARIRGMLLGAFFFLAFVFSNPLLTNEMLLLWETPALRYNQLEGSYDVAVVLSGVTAPNRGPYDRIHLHKGADRIMHAVQLYKLGKVEKLLLSGGAGSLQGDSISEATRMQRVMLLAGVPSEALLIEGQSRNTYENARYSRDALQQLYPQGSQRVLLVTSAFHMRRAAACFQKQGLQVTPFSTDFYSMERAYGLEHLLVPDPEAVQAWSRLLKEWGGFISYKVAGYI